MQNILLIAAGGVGRRIGEQVPKQFIKVQGKTLLQHTLECFVSYVDEVVLATHPDYLETTTNIAKQAGYLNPIVVQGGKERFYSVQNAIRALSNQSEAIVLIHDAVRPMVGKELIKSSIQEAKKQGNSLPLIELADSIRRVEGKKSEAQDRSKFRLVQTPQTFLLSKLRVAFQESYQNHFTDEATLLESVGESIHFIEGDPHNRKITYPVDLEFFEFWLSKQKGI